MIRRRLMGVHRKWMLGVVAAAVALLNTGFGFGPTYVLLHPAGPVARKELNLMVLAGVAMGILILIVFALFFYTIIRFRDTPGNRAPYLPNWHTNKALEVAVWVGPAILLTIIAIPTVKGIYALDHLPKAKDPLVIDVTSLTWKWLFEYPKQHIATVNYIVVPKGRPVLFEITADSPMNGFWVPQLGGMEMAMPNRVLPLWLEASRTGTFWGHSAQFSGVGFSKMFFDVKAVSLRNFNHWAAATETSQPMTMARYRQLLRFNTVGKFSYGSYPSDTFPTVATGFTLTGSGMYTVMHGQKGNKYLLTAGG